MRRWGRRPRNFAHASVWPQRRERLGEAASSSLIVEGRNVIVTEVVERAVAERPGHDTIERIIEWLTGDARQIGSFARTIDELSWRLVAAGITPRRGHRLGGPLAPAFLWPLFRCVGRHGRPQEGRNHR